MAWFSGKVSLGNFPDFAGAVNKLSESVKNIEKNFDTALGLEEKLDAETSDAEKSDALTSTSEASGLWRASSDGKALFEPILGFMGNRGGESAVETSEKRVTSKPQSPLKEKEAVHDDSSVNVETTQTPLERTKRELQSSEALPGSREEMKDNKEEQKDNAGAIGNQVGENTVETSEKPSSTGAESPIKEHEASNKAADIANSQTSPSVSPNEEKQNVDAEPESAKVMTDTSGQREHMAFAEQIETVAYASEMHEVSEPSTVPVEQTESSMNSQEKEMAGEEASKSLELVQPESATTLNRSDISVTMASPNEATDLPASTDEHNTQEDSLAEVSSDQVQVSTVDEADKTKPSDSDPSPSDETGTAESHSENSLPTVQRDGVEASETVSRSLTHEDADTISIGLKQLSPVETHVKEQNVTSGTSLYNTAGSVAELEKVKRDMKMMESALQGAARQAQAKADEIARLLNENEQLKTVIGELRAQSNEAEIESLREEYHQRVSTLERKVYALTRERDTLRREQNKKSDAAALLKEKDEIINQVMAEGEQLSKKQAAQESQIRKLRAQIRELEEEKKGLTTKLQVEENKVESIKRDKAATEKLLQETIEKHQAELATQKEYYTNALNAAKEAEALAEARANTEARAELESRLREAEDRESMLVQALEELRQTLSRKEQQAVFREDMLRRDIEDLQKRYQASERRCEELITQVPDSTRPLLRQIEAMQETASRRAEAWAAVERSLTSRLQEAEAKAAASEEREKSINERLSQTLSRINVLEAQISCLRTEQSQLTRSLEKERHRAAENRQEYLALKEEADTHEGRVNQLEEEIRELRRKHKEELQDALTHQELLQQELEREKAARLDQEKAANVRSSAEFDQKPIMKQKSATFDNGYPPRKLSSAGSLSSMEESYFLQTSLDSSDNWSERRNAGEGTMSPYYMKSMNASTFEAALRQKEGELASYMSRLASMESIRDSLAEELVKMTAECEKLRAEAATLPGIRAELEALRRRHSAALELMGERDEELEELRADIVDLKEMYREQVNLLVNKIHGMSSSVTV